MTRGRCGSLHHLRMTFAFTTPRRFNRRTGGEIMKTLIALALAVVALFPTCLRAAPAKPALGVVVLGSGGPRPFGRGGSSFIVLIEGTPRILVDAGPGAFLRIGELDLDLDN